MPQSDRPSNPAPSPPVGEPTGVRLLFLDDDPQRAAVFLDGNPTAVWVQTVAECLAKLEGPWDEVHLDHDLGGEHFVDISRDDCGMEVVRWLCLTPRPHLRRTRFVIHSHNPNAATMMGMQMLVSGYAVEVRPFGAPPGPPLSFAAAEPEPSPLAALGRWVRRLLGIEGPGYPDEDIPGYPSDEPFPGRADGPPR
jgi:hypothetical protein